MAKQGKRAQAIADMAGIQKRGDVWIDVRAERDRLRAIVDEYTRSGSTVLRSAFDAEMACRVSFQSEAERLRADRDALLTALKDALDALDNDRLAGQYVTPTKRQNVNDRSMNAELAHVAMEAEKRARAALARAEKGDGKPADQLPSYTDLAEALAQVEDFIPCHVAFEDGSECDCDSCRAKDNVRSLLDRIAK